jgi:hypothetical protein
MNVFLPSDSIDFEVEKMVNKLAKDETQPGSSPDAPDVEGTEFHEEEIEEGEFAPDTQIIDLKGTGPSQPANLAPVEITNESKVKNSIGSSAQSGVDVTLSERVLTTASGAPQTKPSMEGKTRGVGLALGA